MRAHRPRYALVGIAAWVACAATAQVRAKRVVPVDRAARQTFEEQREAGIAVLVGVGSYPRLSGLSQLLYPARDVNALQQELAAQRYTVIAVKDAEATKAAVMHAIQQAGEAIDAQHGTVIFFFSGHGFQMDGANYLATYDAGVDNLAQSGLSLDVVRDALVKTGAARRVMWIDACRNEPGKAVPGGRTFAAFRAAEGTRILFSTQAGKISYEDDALRQGAFSYFLARGLHGEAAGPDGLITSRDLTDYVIDSVRQRSLNQGHVQIPYEGGESSGDFLLAGKIAAVPHTTETPDPGSEPPPRVGGKFKVAPGDRPGEVRLHTDGLNYVWVPPGRFTMGCSSGDADCAKDEKPAREVSIAKGFWLAQSEVTQDAFQNAMGSNPSTVASFSLPVERVTWNEAAQYCKSVDGRLPTEAEWEYAGRAGTAGPRYGTATRIGWFKDNRTGETETHSIAKLEANAWGLHDMLGNVAEWVADWYDAAFYSTGRAQDPTGPASGRYRVRRGGDFTTSAKMLRVSARDKGAPDQRYPAQGFRCAVDVH